MRNKLATKDIADILRSQGNRVTEAASIDDAERIAKKTGADLIIFVTEEERYGFSPRDCAIAKMLLERRPGFVC